MYEGQWKQKTEIPYAARHFFFIRMKCSFIMKQGRLNKPLGRPGQPLKITGNKGSINLWRLKLLTTVQSLELFFFSLFFYFKAIINVTSHLNCQKDNEFTSRKANTKALRFPRSRPHCPAWAPLMRREEPRPPPTSWPRPLQMSEEDPLQATCVRAAASESKSPLCCRLGQGIHPSVVRCTCDHPGTYTGWSSDDFLSHGRRHPSQAHC